MKKKLLTMIFALAFALSGCSGGSVGTEGDLDSNGSKTQGNTGAETPLGDGSTSFGAALDESGAYDGYFEQASKELTVTCISGSADRYTLEGDVLTFGAMDEASVYSISGEWKGSIVIDVGDGCDFELELCGFSMVSEVNNPILIKSGEKVRLSAKKDTTNYVYDMRAAVPEEDETQFSGAVHAAVDLVIGGKGELTVVSENNNGIHTKDDLKVKNLTLTVACVDNALKGNDSVTLTDAALTLIATTGDGIKTSNSNVSEKGNQRGTVTLSGGSCTVYAACDGIDAAYDVVMEGEGTLLSIYTDRYSNYSKEVTAVSEEQYYIRFGSRDYSYSVQYYNSEEDFVWVDATYHSATSGGWNTYYYYAFPKKSEYAKLRFFIYDAGMEQGQAEDYAAASDYITPSDAYDTIAISGGSFGWTNYTTTVQGGGFGGPGGMGGGPGGMGGGPGGMNEGNPDKGDHSTKGIKASNEIAINNGTIYIKSYDDALHAGDDLTLENGVSPTGNVTVTDGALTLYSNDDGIHADGVVSIEAGAVNVVNSYEGVEGTQIFLVGGALSVRASDDGINSTATAGMGVSISGGTVYIHCGGDGIDSNSRTAYEGIVFAGGKVVVISNSNGNSAIDTEQGYQYTGGTVIALMPRGGMANEATHCQSFDEIGFVTQASLGKGEYLSVKTENVTVTVQIPASLSAYVIVLGDKEPQVSTASSTERITDANGVAWN